VLRFVNAGGWASLTLFRLNGLWFWKKPLFFLKMRFSGLAAGGGSSLMGEVFPLGGSTLENDVA
jgi:hypothetical protein